MFLAAGDIDLKRKENVMSLLQRTIENRFDKAQGILDIMDWALFSFLIGCGDIYYVDSNNGSDSYDGRSQLRAKATLDAGHNLMSANDVLLVMPGHAETLTGAADITFDTAGVRILCLGDGDKRATFTVATDNNEAAPILISADDVVFKGSRIKGGKTGGSKTAISISGSYVSLEDMEFVETANTLELGVADGFGIITIDDSAAAVTNITLKNIKTSLASGGNDESFLALNDGSNGLSHLRIENCDIFGTFADGVLQLDAGTNPLTFPLIKGSVLLNDLATGGAGACVQVDAGDALIMIDSHALSADGDAEPISNDAASYLSNTFTCEAGAYGLTSVNGSATDWSS